MTDQLIVHEKTYKKKDVASLIHRNRLKSIQRVFARFVSPSAITWADFGCSNGFIPEEIVRENRYAFTRIVGYDYVEGLLELARAKGIPNAEFRHFDMNALGRVDDRYDLVTCFETLEHVGNPKHALINLFNHLGPGGTMIITVPNETGVAGLIKFFGRLAFRRSPYKGFFPNTRSWWEYVFCLLGNGYIDRFRKPDQPGYGPHLGFDYRKLEALMTAELKEDKRRDVALVERTFTGLGMNVVYVLTRK